MRKHHPFASGKLPHQVLFDLHRIACSRQSQTAGDPPDVRIDDDAGRQSIGGPQDHVGRLAPDAGQLDQCLQIARHLPVVLRDQLGTAGPDVLRLVAKESGALDRLFQTRQRQFRQVVRRRITAKQLRRHLVHSLVGALRRQNRRHEQLHGRFELQGALRVRILRATASRFAERRRRGLWTWFSTSSRQRYLSKSGPLAAFDRSRADGRNARPHYRSPGTFRAVGTPGRRRGRSTSPSTLPTTPTVWTLQPPCHPAAKIGSAMRCRQNQRILGVLRAADYSMPKILGRGPTQCGRAAT